MNGSTANSSFSLLPYYWAECYNEIAADGVSKVKRPSAGLIVLYITYCFEFSVGLPLNLWLICHILKRRSKVTGVLSADFYPLHLAISQLLFYLILPVFFANQYLWGSNNWLGMVTFLNVLVLTLKPLLLCVMCVDRYLAVVRPFVYQRFKTRKYRWGSLGVIWFIYFSMASYVMLKFNSFSVCVLFLPILAIDTFCCLSVLKTLQKPPPGDRNMMEKKKTEGSRAEGGTEEKKEENGKKAERSKSRGKGQGYCQKRRAFNIIVINQAVLTLNYIPFIITMFVGREVTRYTQKCQLVALGLSAAVCGTFLQPLLHLQKLGKLPCMRPWNT